MEAYEAYQRKLRRRLIVRAVLAWVGLALLGFLAVVGVWTLVVAALVLL